MKIVKMLDPLLPETYNIPKSLNIYPRMIMAKEARARILINDLLRNCHNPGVRIK